ncbi:MAG: hypothetical protein LQ337_001552 [Flavoplaca oasis]|nr:MAG: hypothetical protein LQ337_001552 [Flavoplaca oasis]
MNTDNPFQQLSDEEFLDFVSKRKTKPAKSVEASSQLRRHLYADADNALVKLLYNRTRELGTVASWKSRREGKKDVFEAQQACAREFEMLRRKSFWTLMVEQEHERLLKYTQLSNLLSERAREVTTIPFCRSE